jgi:hypothetical protein
MTTIRWASRARRLGAIVALVAPLISCNEDIALEYKPTGVAAEVDAIRLAIGTGTQNITVYKDGKVTLGPLIYTRPSAIVTATLLDASGNPMTNVNPAELQVNMGQENGVSNNLQVNFTRLTPFSGRLSSAATGTVAGQSNFTVVLFDRINRRNVFGPYQVALTIR